MFRRFVLAALGALALVLPATARASSTPAPSKESGSPINDQGSNYNYRSDITGVTPNVPGLHLEVLEFADRLVLRNQTGKTITVYGYQGEPYARVLANGTVQVNTRSPAYYLNQNFYGEVNVPASASPTAAPHWILIDRTGQIEWHDHRIHYMSPALPSQVKDKSKRTKIFDWQVPIAVGSTRGAVHGELLWVPEEGTKTPLAAIIALVLIVLAGLALVLVVRRRRGGAGGPPSPQGEGREERRGRSAKEAW
ncbi:MAG TPA: hypothetical protein VMB05_07275 [Solirubrobacteraceae bacterium]|nr:hypothetical protein [Solirubrobacteraceae bacterium]